MTVLALETALRALLEEEGQVVERRRFDSVFDFLANEVSVFVSEADDGVVDVFGGVPDGEHGRG